MIMKRVLFTMNQRQYDKMESLSPLDSNSVDDMKIVNQAWKELGKEMGFLWHTAGPANTGNDMQFMAVPLPSVFQGKVNEDNGQLF